MLAYGFMRTEGAKTRAVNAKTAHSFVAETRTLVLSLGRQWSDKTLTFNFSLFRILVLCFFLFLSFSFELNDILLLQKKAAMFRYQIIGKSTAQLYVLVPTTVLFIVHNSTNFNVSIT